MDEYFNTFKSRLRGFKLDDALLHLNFILQASQNPDLNTDIYNFALENPDAVADYKVEFTAKWLIVESNFDSSVILSPNEFKWPNYLELSQLFNRINDPVVHDEKFKNRNPVELFVRLLCQQLPGQNRIILQSFGSMYLLFKETSEKLTSQNGYYIPRRFEEISGLSIEQFMQLGFIFYSACAGPFHTRGVVSLEWLGKARKQGIPLPSQERIERFLKIVSCDYNQFRILAKLEQHKVDNSDYVLYEFNPLKKRPLIQIRSDRWVAPNPELIIDRVTTGIYYDFLDVDHESFTTHFGVVFQEYIGDLLKTVLPPENVFRERAYGNIKHKKKGPADWTIIDKDFALLLECKSFIPNLNFISIASNHDIKTYAERIANAIEQTFRHIKAIEAGEPELQIFARFIPKIIVLTMGRVQTANTIFFRSEIDRILGSKNINNMTYVVLSLQELEHLLSLVERNVSFSDLILRLEGTNQHEALAPFREMLSHNAVPSIVANKGKEVIRIVELTDT